MSDTEGLVERCQAGDPEAFRTLFRQHRDDVARLVYRMASAHEVDDLVQEVFLQVHRSIRDFKRQARFSTWLYRVTVNVVLMHRRAGRSRPTLVDEEAARPPVSAGPLPDEETATSRRVAAFRRLVERLSEKKRTVFVLHELEGVSPTAIAEIVGAPVLTVRTRLFYARKELASMLEDEPDLAHLADDLARDNDARVVARRMRKGSTT